MDAIIAGFSDAARRCKELSNEVSRRTKAKVSIDEEMRRIVVHTKEIKPVVRTPGIDRAAYAYKADKEPRDIAKRIVRLLRELEDKYETTITKYRLELHAEDSRIFDQITREVFAQASYRASPEAKYVVYVDVISSGAYVYHERLEGPGGIPAGVSGNAVALVDGSVESFVAAYMAMRRGFRVIGVYPMLTLRGKSLEERVVKLAENIDDRFVIKPIDLTEDYNTFIDDVYDLELNDYAAIAVRLRLIRHAASEAKRLGIKNLIIPDVLMSDPTQTPKILRAADLVASNRKVHIFRPILTFNSREIRRWAEFLELEDARDPIDLPAQRKVDDDTLKILMTLAQDRAAWLRPLESSLRVFRVFLVAL